MRENSASATMDPGTPDTQSGAATGSACITGARPAAGRREIERVVEVMVSIKGLMGVIFPKGQEISPKEST